MFQAVFYMMMLGDEVMPTDRGYHPMNDPLIAELFHKEYTGLVRYAEIMYRKFGGYVDPRGRAEEIVQEAFFLAAEKRDELLEREDKRAWLVSAVSYKVRDALKEDRKWAKGLLLLPDEHEVLYFPETEESPVWLPHEDYVLLKRLYVEGYTYQELCAELGLSKSALAMKISRIKRAAKKNFEKFSEKV